MTYKQLLEILLQATACELQQNVTVHAKELDEFYPVTHVRVSGEGSKYQDFQQYSPMAADGILDDGHLYLEIEG